MVSRVVILHVCCPGAFGGLERVVQALALGHVRQGHTVHVAAVLTHAGGPPDFLAVLAQAGVGVEIVAVGPRAYWAERRAMAALCTRLRPAVLHTHGYRPDVIDAPVARAAGIPVVTTVHGRTGMGWRERWYERMQYRGFRRFDAVVAVSRPLVDVLAKSGVRRERLHFIQNAWGGDATAAGTLVPLDRVAARRALGVPESGVRIGWVGRLSAEKGPDILVDAVPLIRSDVAISVLGDGSAREALQARARRRGVDPRISWHGAVPGAGRLYRAFDLFVLSSRTEGTPVVLFEAMAAGVPIVATAVGGVPDVVSAAEATLVPSEDPCALARAIDAVCQDGAAAARRVAAAGERLAREFAAAPWLERYETLYGALARQRVDTGPR